MDWVCRYCRSTDLSDVRKTGENLRYVASAYCRRCRTAYLHHIPWATYTRWQQRGCAICGMKEHADQRRKKMLEVDHDHSCCPVGAFSCGHCVRGLVCHPHNQLIRQIEDGTIARMQAYLSAR